jgi:hypothetical protein
MEDSTTHYVHPNAGNGCSAVDDEVAIFGLAAGAGPVCGLCNVRYWVLDTQQGEYEEGLGESIKHEMRRDADS